MASELALPTSRSELRPTTWPPGGDLTQVDVFTASMLTNAALLEVEPREP
jgi:hypothetical protein